MKAKLALLVLAALCLQPSALHAQGALTPPGPPAPMMKTLDQIEPRTIVNAMNTPGDATNAFIITHAGSYYLATNLVGVSGRNGIKIAANHVTLDLNGFALLGGSDNSGFHGIDVPAAQTNLTVRNGTLNMWGIGVNIDSGSSINVLVERLNVSDCFYGIVSHGVGLVRDCNSQGSSMTGIVTFGGVVSGCTACNNQYGIVAAPGTVSGCWSENNVLMGIEAGAAGCAVIGNNCLGNNTAGSPGGAGIYIIGSNSRIEANQVTASGYAGIKVATGTRNLIIKNSVLGSGTNNYYITSGQIVGLLVTNTISGIITNANPWANFSF